MKQVMLTNEEIGSVTLALAHLFHAGIGTGDALTLLREDENDPALRELLGKMAARTDAGAGLAAAFREAGCFPAYVCTLVEVGEQVGKLEQTLSALAVYYQGRARLTQRLKTALTYPALLLMVLLAVVTVLLVWVLPVFDDVYARLGSRLTGVAGGLLTLGAALKQSLPVWLLLIAAVGCLAAIPGLRKKVLTLWQKRWGDRGVFGKINTARFVQVLSLATSSGMTAREAVAMASDMAEVPAFRKRCEDCLAHVDAGESLSKALRLSGMLESAQCRLLEAGERSGQGEKILEELSRRLLEDSEEALEREAGKAEPAMVAVACLLIGAVLLSVMLPLMNIMSAIG